MSQSQLSDKANVPTGSEGHVHTERMSGSSIGRTILLDEPPSRSVAPIFLHKPRGVEKNTTIREGNGSQSEVGRAQPPKAGENVKSGATVRKRSRIGDNPGFDKLKLSEDGGYKKRIEDYMQQLMGIIETIIKKGDKTKFPNDKALINEVMKDVSNEIIKILSTSNVLAERLLQLYEGKQVQEQKIIKLSEENNCLRQQIIELQVQTMQQNTANLIQQPTTAPYLQAALKNATKNIIKGTSLPVPVIPDTVKHSPAERILLFKAKTKREQANKSEQETFRKDLENAIGEMMMKQLVVIRPTKFGGHTVIFQDEKSRDKALQMLRLNESKMGIEEKMSCIIAPKRKMAKAICRVPPEDITPDKFLNDLYGTYNPHLHQIPRQKREARIITSSTLGWIFELSSDEAQAFFLQNGRIRFGYGRELKAEEFIPLQQCYKCCAFGHNASECMSEHEYCRLCAKMGHAGKDCAQKDDKKQWSCVNCRITNEAKGYKLSTEHAAAQLHKCPCAHNQKMIKKQQLAAAGVFTTPLTETLIQEYERSKNNETTQGVHGPQEQQKNNERSTVNKHRKHRSRSVRRNLSNKEPKNNQSNEIPSSSSSQIIGNTNKDIIEHGSIMANVPRSTYGSHRQRSIREDLPKSTEGWKAEKIGNMEERGRDSTGQQMGTNSMNSDELGLMSDTEDHME